MQAPSGAAVAMQAPSGAAVAMQAPSGLAAAIRAPSGVAAPIQALSGSAAAIQAPLTGAHLIGIIKDLDKVRVWFPHEEPPAWFYGTVGRIMPASVEVYYEGSDTYCVHRLRTTQIELLGDDKPQLTTSENEPARAEEVQSAAAAIGTDLLGGQLLEEPPKPKKVPHSKLTPAKSLDECGYHNRRFRTGVAGTLWQMLLFWMCGSCGLFLYIQISVMAMASSTFFHLMNWCMGADETPRLLQENGEFVPLPPGRRALELPDQTLAFLRELNIARACWRETFKAEIELAKSLPEHLHQDILKSIPAAYDAAISKYKSHLTSYQLLPNSLSRISEPTGPPYIRAFISVFFPSLATLEGFDVVRVSDEDLVQSGAEELIEILAEAIADSDEGRQQFAHERLFMVSVYNNARRVAAEYVEAATAAAQKSFEIEKDAARTAGTPVPKRRKPLRKGVRDEAAVLRAQAMEAQECNTLGLREGCAITDGKPNETLSQLLCVARTNSASMSSPDPILWGAKCECAGSCHHLPNCWKNVDKLYWFLQQKSAFRRGGYFGVSRV